MKNIAFFLSANDLVKKYTDPTLELVKLSVEAGYGFVYGGTGTGLMSEASDLATSLGGHITAITSKEFVMKLKVGADEEYIGEDVLERKRMFIDHSDAFIALPGGSGTLDEISAVIEGKKLNLHFKPIILFNTQGFWNGLIEQYAHMRKEGFLPMPVEDLFFVSVDPIDTINYLQSSFK